MPSRTGKHRRTQKPLTPEEEQNIEANYFAAHLLVPSSLLKKEMAKLKLKEIDLVDDDPRVDQLAKLFEVSRSLMLSRILEEAGVIKDLW